MEAGCFPSWSLIEMLAFLVIARPQTGQRSPSGRSVPTLCLRDYNVIELPTTTYNTDTIHESRLFGTKKNKSCLPNIEKLLAGDGCLVNSSQWWWNTGGSLASVFANP